MGIGTVILLGLIIGGIVVLAKINRQKKHIEKSVTWRRKK